MVIRIPAADDPRLADYVNVREAELVKRRGIFIAEGTETIRLLHRSRFPIRSVFLSEKQVDRFQEVLTELDPSIPIYVAAQEVMQEVVGYRFHRGCLAAGTRVDLDAREAILGGELGSTRTVIVLEGLVDHDNIGSIFRNAAAFGVDGVLLDPTCADPLYRKATRVSMGQTLQLPFARLTEWSSAIEDLKQRGYVCFALTPRSSAWPLEGLLTQPLPERVALLLGTEGTGLTEAALDACTALFRIPMASGVDSLNVATTSGIALYLLQLARERTEGV